MKRKIKKNLSPTIKTDVKGINTLLSLLHEAVKTNDHKIVFNKKSIYDFDGNLFCIYAYIANQFIRKNNHLHIWPTNNCSVNAFMEKNLFGCSSNFDLILAEKLFLNCSRVFQNEKQDKLSMLSYLTHELIKPKWKSTLPYHYITRIKRFINLYWEYTIDKSGAGNILIGSNFEDNVVSVTMIDTSFNLARYASIFKPRVNNDYDALLWLLTNTFLKAKLQRLFYSFKMYCQKNEGNLTVYAGSYALAIDKRGEYTISDTTVPITGLLVSFTIKTEMVQFDNYAIAA
jgi:hypothetical protein